MRADDYALLVRREIHNKWSYVSLKRKVTTRQYLPAAVVLVIPQHHEPVVDYEQPVAGHWKCLLPYIHGIRSGSVISSVKLSGLHRINADEPVPGIHCEKVTVVKGKSDTVQHPRIALRDRMQDASRSSIDEYCGIQVSDPGQILIIMGEYKLTEIPVVCIDSQDSSERLIIQCIFQCGGEPPVIHGSDCFPDIPSLEQLIHGKQFVAVLR